MGLLSKRIGVQEKLSRRMVYPAHIATYRPYDGRGL